MRVGGSIIATALVATVGLAASCSSSTGKGFDNAPLDASSDSEGLDGPVSLGPGTDVVIPSILMDGCDLECEAGHPTIALRVVDAHGNSVPAPAFSTAGQPVKPLPSCGEAVNVDGGSFGVIFAGPSDGGTPGDAADGGPSNCDVWVLVALDYSLSTAWTVLVRAPGYEAQTVTVMLRAPTGCTCDGPYGSQTVTLSLDANPGDTGTMSDAAPGADGDGPSGEGAD
ncbi:MAG: hypothetical protein ACLP1X_30505 [Polyangiaceae bacterium]